MRNPNNRLQRVLRTSRAANTNRGAEGGCLAGKLQNAGAKGRWKRFLLNKIVAADAHVDDVSISPVVRQTLLHWAYEVNQEDIRRHLKLRK